MRLLIFSNAPQCGTGYGVQAALLGPRLRDAGHEVAYLAYFGLEGYMSQFEGIPVFPRSRVSGAQDWMVPLARTIGADAIVSITDPWVIETQRFAGTDIAYVPWFPVDGVPMDGENVRGVTGPGPASRLPVATSRHAQEMAADKGIESVHIPYMVDTAVYAPGDRREARAQWHLPESAFVVGMVAMNKLAGGMGGVDRKRYFEQIGAFAQLRERHPEALLFLHTHPVAPDGLNLISVLEHYDIPPESYTFTDGGLLTVGCPAQLMAQLYQSFDVLLGCSGGEGAGMPLLEASACGTPCIWGEWTAMPEYAKAGWPVLKTEAQQALNAARVTWWTPSVDAIADRLQAAYDCPGEERRTIAEEAVEGAKEHDADLVVRDLWLPALHEVDQRRTAAAGVQEVEIPEELRGIAGVAA